MSRDTVVAKRYAKALFELAQEQSVVHEVEEQLKLIASALNQDPEIEKFLLFPGIGAEKKIEAIKGALGDRLSALVLHTVELLIVRGHQDVIADVYEAFTKIAGEALGQAHASVYSAKQLTANELAEVTSQFEQITGKKIIPQTFVEPSLLGGVQVRIGDRLYDGSLSGKLERLQKALK
ncbi:F0F1 ATP synthase subunit delta [Paenibacillus protaetiae]|uniref:ATP synthase subunit delta n=1 Tax=Paenibacillus protaetiae TaxID=2509456 RepID=A0A4P6F0S5_9BACL|nr:F0F1 ATP synthase subunit delta [Paenibacillus protaetiae]QAY67709.1 F0F1 ATP synthase subunit delta [Paenibacillus protaetiae]